MRVGLHIARSTRTKLIASPVLHVAISGRKHHAAGRAHAPVASEMGLIGRGWWFNRSGEAASKQDQRFAMRARDSISPAVGTSRTRNSSWISNAPPTVARKWAAIAAGLPAPMSSRACASHAPSAR
jgi:hypothetical protein